VRSGGGSWADVAALSGLSEDQVRERWRPTGLSRIADPVAEAASLDDWYIKHAQLEPLAQVRDPFSRLLSAHAPLEHECLICVKYSGGVLPAYGGYTSPPGGYVVDDGMWRVAHGPISYWPAGTLLIEAHRHFLDYAEMTDAEAAAIGALIRRLVGPLKEATGAPRIHVFSSMEGAEHFHVWLVPRTGEVPSGRTFIANPGYCSVPEAEAAIWRLRKAMARGETTQ
jgi:diadenosine tetraphosphate (Ap4A) HIT family hydrolase